MTQIVADACSSHNGSRELMEKMIKSASKIGVDLIKFQSFKADNLNKSWPDYENSLAYYKSVELSETDHVFILDKCKKYGIEPLFTAFCLESADYLATLGLDTVKIASPDANNWPLIDKCFANFKQVLISTGLHSQSEIKKLVDKVKPYGNRVTLLHCVSLYPTPPEKVNLLRIAALMQEVKSVGFSDHSLSLDAAKIAMNLGVSVIERHFTLDRDMPGKDQKISSVPKDFKELVEWRNKVQTMMYCREKEVDSENRRYISRWNNA